MSSDRRPVSECQRGSGVGGFGKSSPLKTDGGHLVGKDEHCWLWFDVARWPYRLQANVESGRSLSAPPKPSAVPVEGLRRSLTKKKLRHLPYHAMFKNSSNTAREDSGFQKRIKITMINNKIPWLSKAPVQRPRAIKNIFQTFRTPFARTHEAILDRSRG